MIEAGWLIIGEVAIVLILTSGVVFLANRGRLRMSNTLEIGEQDEEADDPDDHRG